VHDILARSKTWKLQKGQVSRKLGVV